MNLEVYNTASLAGGKRTVRIGATLTVFAGRVRAGGGPFGDVPAVVLSRLQSHHCGRPGRDGHDQSSEYGRELHLVFGDVNECEVV